MPRVCIVNELDENSAALQKLMTDLTNVTAVSYSLTTQHIVCDCGVTFVCGSVLECTYLFVCVHTVYTSYLAHLPTHHKGVSTFFNGGYLPVMNYPPTPLPSYPLLCYTHYLHNKRHRNQINNSSSNTRALWFGATLRAQFIMDMDGRLRLLVQ